MMTCGFGLLDIIVLACLLQEALARALNFIYFFYDDFSLIFVNVLYCSGVA